AEDGIRADLVTGVQTCALPISRAQPSCRHLGLRRIVLEGARQTGLSHVDGQVAQVDRIPEHDGLHRAPLGWFGRMGTVSWPEYEIGRASCRDRGWITVVRTSDL